MWDTSYDVEGFHFIVKRDYFGLGFGLLKWLDWQIHQEFCTILRILHTFKMFSIFPLFSKVHKDQYHFQVVQFYTYVTAQCKGLWLCRTTRSESHSEMTIQHRFYLVQGHSTCQFHCKYCWVDSLYSCLLRELFLGTGILLILQ